MNAPNLPTPETQAEQAEQVARAKRTAEVEKRRGAYRRAMAKNVKVLHAIIRARVAAKAK